MDRRQRASRVAAGAAVVALLAACAATSGRPDVAGVVDVDSAGDLVVTQTGVSSYDGMRLAGTDPDVRDADDAPISLDDLAAGDRISVWVDAGCGESDPLSCDVLLVRVTG